MLKFLHFAFFYCKAVSYIQQKIRSNPDFLVNSFG